MSAGVLNYNLQQMFRSFVHKNDPGASNTLEFDHKGLVIFEVTTAGAESRALEAATRHPVDAECVVIAKTLAGNLTITGAVGGSVILTAEGDQARFKVTNVDGTHQWLRVASTKATPEVITGDLSAYNETAFKAVLTALANLGLLTDSTTT